MHEFVARLQKFLKILFFVSVIPRRFAIRFSRDRGLVQLKPFT